MASPPTLPSVNSIPAGLTTSSQRKGTLGLMPASGSILAAEGAGNSVVQDPLGPSYENQFPIQETSPLEGQASKSRVLEQSRYITRRVVHTIKTVEKHPTGVVTTKYYKQVSFQKTLIKTKTKTTSGNPLPEYPSPTLDLPSFEGNDSFNLQEYHNCECEELLTEKYDPVVQMAEEILRESAFLENSMDILDDYSPLP